MTQRIDLALVSRGLAPSRERAQSLISAGMVTLNGSPVKKPSQKIKDTDTILVTGTDCPFVSRGGLKLERALSVFPIDLKKKICADIGASTGGFTDCMLQAGAEKVYAIDVGTGQLHEKLLSDPRVVNMEQTNIRSVDPKELPEFGFISTDVSFISLSHVLPVIKAILSPDGQAVVLVKPQFEAGRDKLNKKGVVRDPKVHLSVLRQVWQYVNTSGLVLLGADYSPIRGPEGNIEYLYFLGMDGKAIEDKRLENIVKEAHDSLN